MAQLLNEQFIRMQKLAGVITESQYTVLAQELTEQQLEEGWKDWLIGGLITLTTLAGGAKVYQLSKDKQADAKAKTEYYQNILAKTVNDYDKSNLASLGMDINQKTKELSIQQGNTAEQNQVIFSRYAEQYMKKHPEQFSISQDGKTIMWTTPTK
jgi:hypothetical protein